MGVGLVFGWTTVADAEPSPLGGHRRLRVLVLRLVRRIATCEPL